MTITDPTFDVIVLGAGPAGEALAGALRPRDLTVAIVESGLVGGECAYSACMPSKALLRPAEVLAETERVPGAAETVRGPLDVARPLARRDEVVHHLDDSSKLGWLRERDIELVRGHGRIAGDRDRRSGADRVAVGPTRSEIWLALLEARNAQRRRRADAQGAARHRMRTPDAR